MEDNKKDIQKDSQGQLTVAHFESYFAYLYKKTDKVSTAIFMVTDSMSDSDDLKKTIRSSALELMSLTKTGSFSRTMDTQRILQDILLNFHKLQSLIDLSGTMDYVSPMNAEILVREISNIIDSASQKRDEYHNVFGYKASPSFVLDTSIFKVEEENFLNTSVAGKGHMSFTNIKDNKTSKPQVKRHIESSSISRNNQNSIPKKDRRLQIMELIKDKKNATIKDISLVMKDCSEKTIQRELADMILGGVLDRKGERRWSTYSLKNEGNQ